MKRNNFRAIQTVLYINNEIAGKTDLKFKYNQQPYVLNKTVGFNFPIDWYNSNLARNTSFRFQKKAIQVEECCKR